MIWSSHLQPFVMVTAVLSQEMWGTGNSCSYCVICWKEGGHYVTYAATRACRVCILKHRVCVKTGLWVTGVGLCLYIKTSTEWIPLSVFFFFFFYKLLSTCFSYESLLLQEPSHLPCLCLSLGSDARCGMSQVWVEHGWVHAEVSDFWSLWSWLYFFLHPLVSFYP